MSDKQSCVQVGQRTTRLVDQAWVQELLARESFTSKEAGELAGGGYGSDVLTQLRKAKGLRLVQLGRLPGGHPQARLFKLVRLEEKSYSTPLIEYIRAQQEWSARTFGPGTREKGVIDHITKELKEIAEATTPAEKLAEWIDILILGFDGAWRTGATAEQIVEALGAKQVRNFNRTWPDWRTMSEDQAIEHDRTGELTYDDEHIHFDGCGHEPVY